MHSVAEYPSRQQRADGEVRPETPRTQCAHHARDRTIIVPGVGILVRAQEEAEYFIINKSISYSLFI